MGGGSYNDDVASRSRDAEARRRSSGASFGYTPTAKTPAERKVHSKLNPKKSVRECLDNPDHPETTPIAILMDVTESRGNDVEVMFVKVPRLIGQIYMRGYMPDPTISYCGVGDATCDHAPLQPGQFEAGNELDAVLSKYIWLEKGGGGTGQESYELAAYYYANKIIMDATNRGKKGILFFTADESPYPVVSKTEVKRIIGDELDNDIPTSKIFAELQKKFDVYLIYIKKPWEVRKQAVDKEIQQRLKRAGGMYEDVDVRFSLIWHDRNDLDIHVITPMGDHIFYRNKVARCGGNLDVDMNVQGETTKPVENVRWKSGSAKPGNYEVWVERYSFHESSRKETPFKVEICIGGEVTTFEGISPANKTGDDSRVDAGTFTFDPNKVIDDKPEDKYAAYRDEAVLAEWAKLLPAENMLVIKDPNAIVDTMLGVLALKGGTRTLAEFGAELKADEQSDERIAEVSAALELLSKSCSATKVAVPAGKPSKVVKNRGVSKLINLG